MLDEIIVMETNSACKFISQESFLTVRKDKFSMSSESINICNVMIVFD
jgi:hypothetical protein